MRDTDNASSIRCLCNIKCEVAVGFIIFVLGVCSLQAFLYYIIQNHKPIAICFGFLAVVLIMTGIFMLIDSYRDCKYEAMRQHQRELAFREFQRQNVLMGQRELARLAYRRQREEDLIALEFQNQEGYFQERGRLPPLFVMHGNGDESVDEGYSHSPLYASDESTIDANSDDDNADREGFRNLSNRNSENENTDQSNSSEHGEWL